MLGRVIGNECKAFLSLIMRNSSACYSAAPMSINACYWVKARTQVRGRSAPQRFCGGLMIVFVAWPFMSKKCSKKDAWSCATIHGIHHTSLMETVDADIILELIDVGYF
jgi:hypothetical protein